MDQKGPSKVVLKKKKTDVSLLKLTKSDTGIPRIPKTFVFDQNLPKEEYLKYINPENIIPESLEVATKVFSSYRKRIGGSGIEALNQDLPQILKPKSSLPFFDHNKSSAREIASYRENAPSYEGSVMHDTKLHVSMKKTMDKSRHDEIIQDNTLDLKGMLKDIASFSASQEHRNEGYTDGQQTSPNRAKGSLRNGDDSINLSKIKRGAQEKEKEDLTGAGQNSGKENVKKNYHHHKRSEGDIIHMMAKKKKKKVTADQYEITDLDNTQEIVRKTDVAVKTLSKRSEQVKREMKNFEENVKAKLKESESAPISSLRAVNLVRDYVFNEEEFAKLIEEEEREEEREKAQKEYNQRNQLKKKKVNLKPTESKVKGFNNTMTARFTHIPFPKASPRNDAITITKEEKKKVEHVVEQHVAIKEEELKKQVEVQMRIHEKYGVFSNENNLFRINSMNYTKLMKEKEKIRDHLLQELKHTKYKERERESKMFTAQSHRVRSIHSDRPSRQDLDYGREDDKGKDVIKKEDAKTQYINKIKEVLTKPVKDNIGSKPSELSTHVNRLYGLRKKYTTTDIEKVNQASYHNL